MTGARGSEGAPAGDGSSSALREDSSEPAATTGTGTGTSSGTGTGTETGTGPGLKSQVDLSSACRILVCPVETVAATLEGGSGTGSPKLQMLPQPAQDTGSGQEFSPQAIVQLIQAVGRRWEQYSTRERGQLFQGVQEELAQNGLAFPLERIRRKWNNLLVTYKRVYERARATGQHTTTWEYYEMMDAFLSVSSKSQGRKGTITSMGTTSTIAPPAATASAALSLAASSCILAAQEERGRVGEEWRRREEERERRRERRERRALGTLGRLVTTLELLSSKQDTVNTLLQRLADRHWGGGEGEAGK
ncbi:uncharacterized protein LOC136751522 [Amia ocellicauda]|uniref:uncharacterized protein LOC136751522 n=1 Tax=Amia ocellicauda TaxID=2972642 RepID=UPI003463E534